MSTVSALIRQHVEALPEHQRQPWEYRATSVYMDGRSRGSLVAVPHVGPSVATDIVGPAGELAALFGPPVATALADLLDAVERHGQPRAGELVGDPHPLRVIRAAADALTAAISRSEQST